MEEIIKKVKKALDLAKKTDQKLLEFLKTGKKVNISNKDFSGAYS